MRSQPPPGKLLDQVRAALRRKPYAIRTGEASVNWIRCCIHVHGIRYPREPGAAEVSALLTYLAVGREVAASTRNQALSALRFRSRAALLQPHRHAPGVVRRPLHRHTPGPHPPRGCFVRAGDGCSSN